jgi:hypothetical protein
MKYRKNKSQIPQKAKVKCRKKQKCALFGCYTSELASCQSAAFLRKNWLLMKSENGGHL